jgi:leucyl/phenylalanyl-tRNA--protein transferase
MFRRQDASGRDASKVCLVWLVEHLQTIGVSLLDIQFMTPHLRRFGACEIPAKTYLGRLAEAVTLDCDW